MNKSLFIRYAEIKNQMKALKEQEDELNKQVLAELENDGVVKAESDFGTFSVVERKTYKFDDETTNHLKEYKKSIESEAIKSGKAEEQINKSLRYTNAKN